MAMVKEALVNAGNSVSTMRHERSKNKNGSRRWGDPLYPSETTTIKEAVLDKAIEDAIEKRLRHKR